MSQWNVLWCILYMYGMVWYGMAWRDPTQICHHIFRYSFLIYFSQSTFRAHSRRSRIIIQCIFTTFFLSFWVFFSLSLSPLFVLFVVRFWHVYFFFSHAQKLHQWLQCWMYGCLYVWMWLSISVRACPNTSLVTCVRYRPHYIIEHVFCIFHVFEVS